jgi:hypothetical protein
MRLCIFSFSVFSRLASVCVSPLCSKCIHYTFLPSLPSSCAQVGSYKATATVTCSYLDPYCAACTCSVFRFCWFFYFRFRLCGSDRLCGLVIRVLGYRSGGPGSIPGITRKKLMCLERGPLCLVSTTEVLLDRKSIVSCLEIREYGRRDPSR